jgi:NADP-dependent 3-hydroxy acid dehydrogenase YdfG
MTYVSPKQQRLLLTSLGIGKSTAFALAQNGISGLALVDLNLSLLENVQTEIQSQHPDVDVEILQVNVADESSVDTAVQKTVEHFGHIDIGVNCAGISGNPTSTHQMSLTEWKKVIDINQTGVWLCQRALIRQMLTQE